MSDQNTLANFKLTTIELIEDFLLEKIKNIVPDILGTETIVETDVDPTFRTLKSHKFMNAPK
jgi:hypothetical protein